MGERTAIEWTDATWNPIRARHRKTRATGWYCQRVSPGCKNCYAAAINVWRGNSMDYAADRLADVELFLDEKTLMAPLKWREPRMVFVCSMTDLFAPFVPITWIGRIFGLMAEASRHTFQILTKRPENLSAWSSGVMHYPGGDRTQRPVMGWPPNVWLGVSVENEEMAKRRIPRLLQIRAAVRFVSYEPALGPGNFAPYLPDYHGSNRTRWIDWLICGGESGSGARPMHPDWARSARDQCTSAGVPFFFKQWGKWVPEPAEYRERVEMRRARGFRIHTFEDQEQVWRIGRKAAGRLLDGREWNEYPPQAR